MILRVAESLNCINELMNSIETIKKLESLNAFAESLGFDGFGVASPQLNSAGERFGKWLDAGYDGEMSYIGRR